MSNVKSRSVFNDDPRSNKERVRIRPTDDAALAVNQRPHVSSGDLGYLPHYTSQNRRLLSAKQGRLAHKCDLSVGQNGAGASTQLLPWPSLV